MASHWPIRFLGTGAFLPERVITNQHFIDYLDTSEEWIITRTGIRERRYVGEGESTSTMATEAARRAIEDAGLSVGDIDVIICATATGDHPFPATAAIIQAALGAKQAAAFDISAACAGFLHGLSLATAMLGAGMHKRVLVVGAESLSRVVNPEDRATVILFGDAAGAAVLGHSETDEHGILYCKLGCDGTRAQHIWIPSGGSKYPTSASTVAENMQFMHMRGREVFKFAVPKLAEIIDEALATTGLTPDDLKLVIPHQSNLRIIESARERMGLPREKVAVHIDRYGNTSAASVPLALDEARRNGTLVPGDLVLMVAIGAGLTWGTVIVKL